MRKILIIVIFLSTIAMAGAQETIQIKAPFHSINLSGVMNVKIQINEPGDTITKAEVTVSGIPVNSIKWSIKKQCLNISAERGFLENAGQVDVLINVQTLEKIQVKGATLQCKDAIRGESLLIETMGSINKILMAVETSDLTVKCSGQSDIALSGRVESAWLESLTGARIDMLHCTANKIEAKVGQSAEIYTSVLDLLDVKATMCGTLYYLGAPSLKIKTSLWGAVVNVEQNQ